MRTITAMCFDTRLTRNSLTQRHYHTYRHCHADYMNARAPSFNIRPKQHTIHLGHKQEKRQQIQFVHWLTLTWTTIKYSRWRALIIIKRWHLDYADFQQLPTGYTPARKSGIRIKRSAISCWAAMNNVKVVLGDYAPMWL